jgi:hypothetical protein
MYIVPDSQITFDGELSHHGILGMKWGIRRFQPYKKGEKKGKEVDEAAKKRKQTIKKVATIAGISTALAAGTAITVAAIKSGKEYKNFNKLFGPDNPIRFDKNYYANGLSDRIKKNPIFRTHLSDVDKSILNEWKTQRLSR